VDPARAGVENIAGSATGSTGSDWAEPAIKPVPIRHESATAVRRSEITVFSPRQLAMDDKGGLPLMAGRRA